MGRIRSARSQVYARCSIQEDTFNVGEFLGSSGAILRGCLVRETFMKAEFGGTLEEWGNWGLGKEGVHVKSIHNVKIAANGPQGLFRYLACVVGDVCFADPGAPSRVRTY